VRLVVLAVGEDGAKISPPAVDDPQHLNAVGGLDLAVKSDDRLG
jgi:hypothetical protein